MDRVESLRKSFLIHEEIRVLKEFLQSFSSEFLFFFKRLPMLARRRKEHNTKKLVT
jgi:hypothetical protein